MPFGNNQNQNNHQPANNNRCGGYALYAVLNDFFENDAKAPMVIYNQIQKCQADVPKELGDLIKAMSGDSETNISLPSSLVRCAQSYELAATIHYKRDWKIMNREPEMMSSFINLENGRSGGNTIKVENDHLFDVFNFDIPYFLVLVNNDTHWIAVKREPDRQHFTIYNPGDGNAETVGTNEIQSHLTTHYGAINLIITLQQQQQ